MRKMLLRFAAVLAVFGAAFMFACEEPAPDCEVYDYGTVIVKNSTGIRIAVDVTEGNSDYNDERWLSSGGRTTYSRLDAGSVTMWASPDGYDWVYDDNYLDACEELTYTWYMNKKSTNSLYLEISRNGEVLKTVSDFEYVKRN